MSLISLSNAAIRYGCSNDNFSVMYHYNNKLGKITPWMVIEDGKYFIDTNHYERQSEILKRCWNVNTEYLFWLMMELFQTETKLAEYLTKESSIYKSCSSWDGFLKTTLFSPCQVIKVDLVPTRQTEFTQISVRAIGAAIKKGIKLGSDFE
jgi:hypothetical protein